MALQKLGNTVGSETKRHRRSVSRECTPAVQTVVVWVALHTCDGYTFDGHVEHGKECQPAQVGTNGNTIWFVVLFGSKECWKNCSLCLYASVSGHAGIEPNTQN